MRLPNVIRRISAGTRHAPQRVMRGVQRFTDLRAWQACTVYKKAIYRLIERGVYGNDWKRRGQLEESVAGPPDHIAEGFGRFNPPDFARFTVMARASLMESQSQLEEVTGLMEYLQSPEALRNARRARERRIASRPERLAKRAPRSEPRTPNHEQRTANSEARTPNTELGTEPEHEQSTENPEE
ncbi:MAG: hypothetical protein DMF88_15945 [Acidobacteria bacterium]|nr:MAG: hypothetical protein DMF88_15945 [Acidobacteriota bacterium]